MTIRRQLFPQLDLVVYGVDGVVGVGDFVTAGTALYELETPPRMSLWDLTHASAAEINPARIREIQSALVGQVRGRTGGKTAVVAPNDVVFGVARQYEALARSHNLPMEMQVFRSNEEALRWLEVDGARLDEEIGKRS